MNASFSDILIIGGGASGLTAALAAAQSGASVTVLEAGKKAGSKLLRTGNGRCNLSNTGDSSTAYSGTNAAFAERVLEHVTREETYAFFKSIGVILKSRDGWLYPYNDEASFVRGALLERAEELHVRIRNNEFVKECGKDEGGFYAVSGNWTYRSRRLILACGSPAGLAESSVFFKGELARLFGHTFLPFRSALAPLYVRNPRKELAGIRANASVTLLADDSVIDREDGQVQFTSKGLSGICVFNLAVKADPYLQKGRKVRIVCDFAPDLKDLPGLKDIRETDFIRSIVPEKLYGAVFSKLTLDEAGKLLHHLAFEVTGCAPLGEAQAASGGVLSEEIEDQTMMSRLVPGLYICGEMLDIVGKCGGWNLQFAWSGGISAGRSAAASLASDQ